MKKVVAIIVVLIIIYLVMLVYIVNNNKNYHDSLMNEIKEKYKTEEKINYVNKYESNYIVKTDSNVYALDSDYKEIAKISIDKIKDLDYDIIYRKNAIMYKESKVDGRKVIYTYYDITSGIEIEKVEIEG